MKILAGTLALIIGLSLADPPAPPKPATLYVLHDSDKDVWCGYRDATQWRAAIDQLEALEVASVEYQNQHPQIVKMTTEDSPEAGDWLVYDTYTLNQAGRVISLERITNFLPEDATRTEKYELNKGNLLRISTITKSLTSGRAIPSKQIDFPSLPIATAASDLPFATILDRSQDVWGGRTVCVPPTLSSLK
jgi:hypothetical protein